ncbi:MAG TPA: hypothetical protein VKE96_03830 [Vicinamibacterales bacterium]|nr:hypothetical protein [Vicinamibacterales bacterium]
MDSTSRFAAMTGREAERVERANDAGLQAEENVGLTEIVEMHDRGYGLTIDHGWRDVADVSLAFIRRFVWTTGGALTFSTNRGM